MEIDRENSSRSSQDMKVDRQYKNFLTENYKVSSIFCPST